MVFIKENELQTIQKNNKLNTVYRMDEKGCGGAYHRYSITENTTEENVIYPISEIVFQKGPRNEEGSTRGVLDVDLLEIVKDRLSSFQEGDFACAENEKALQHISEALFWMNQRVENRAKRGVLGTNMK